MSNTKTVRLRFFASVREQVSCAEETVVLPPEVGTVGEVRSWLIARGGIWADAFSLSRHVRTAYQLEVCDASRKIEDGHEIAFFPPVTGG